ncbi:hypothetical protein SUGI_0308520 [Cryptomeria japonica]|uniref:protein RRP6-like 2 n=1 Tax=Cryptomeria japonica TaxID=3369 RepID=UPI002408D093|nr:protein RRP6-like 2 [Cryptomeria japonica]GLJ17682.1 hypothetical protein SUGI_0308520 [Cryptomeria japonica]
MDSDNEETVKDRAENLQKLVRGPLASSVEKLSNSLRNIPLGTDFHFYNNFPDFKHPVEDLKNRSECLLNEIGTSPSLCKRVAGIPVDPDDAQEWIVDVQDDILERVDVSMDEFKKLGKGGKPGSLDDLESGFRLVYGKKKRDGNNRREVGVSKTAVSRVEGGSSGVKVVSRDKKTAGGRSRVPFHLPNISRPQDRYKIFVDNKNTPYKHHGLQTTEDGSKYIHPLEVELNKLEFSDIQTEAPLPLKPYPLESTPFKLVEKVQDLKEMAIKLQAASEIAVDLEHNQYRSFQGLTCLMQISTRSEDFVVDTLILRYHIGPCLKDIFSSPFIKKVMHGADRDILWLQRDFGIFICNLFDTGQASRVLELERNSLEFLLKHYCGITADKEYQTADWRLRPLPPEMLKYAREDTHYLLYIHDVMRQELASLPFESEEGPLLEVYRRSRDICLQLYEKELLTETSYLHVYGLQEENFSQEQLAVVAGLYEWRDGIGRMEDESTGYILPNKVLLQIAKRMPTKLDELRSFVKGRHPFVERNLAAVLGVIKMAKLKGTEVMDIASKPPLQALVEKTDGETAQVDNQPLSVSADTTAENIVSYSQTHDDNVLSSDRLDIEITSVSENSGDIKMIDDKNSFSKEANRREINYSEKVASHNERKSSAVVGRASAPLLFGKKGDVVKGSQPIFNDVKRNLDCQSPSKKLLSLQSPGCVSPERSEEQNFVNKFHSVIQENFQSIRPVDCSNSGNFIPNESSTSVQDGATVDRNLIVSEAREPLVQAQKRPGRGLAAMLGSSKSKQKSQTISKMHDTEQDNVRNKVEHIKASITLPFRPFLGTCEIASIQHSPKIKENSSNQDVTNQSSQVEDKDGDVLCTTTENPIAEIENAVSVLKTAGNVDSDEGKKYRPSEPIQVEDKASEVLCTKTKDPKAEIENAVSALKKSPGIVHGKEGKKYRAWWPEVQFEGVEKLSVSTTETNERKLPLSLSELRQRQKYKYQSSCQLLQSARCEARVNVNDFQSGKKRKNHSPEPYNASKVSSKIPQTESQFKPFDYAAARRSMHFEATNVKGNTDKKFSGKSGKGFIYDPISSVARESSADDIQPGKRRQVFPASGNRSATFR